MKPRVVLYNPRAPYYTMPLALVAVGSALDRSRYEVIVVDGRLEANPSAALVAAGEGAVCVGVSVLTGTPIRDALAATRAVRDARPGCPIVWGGWHPSLFPLATLDQAGLDAVVVGQGEDTFAAIVERLADGLDLSGIDGCVAAPRRGGRGSGLPRTTRDINALPRHDYSLIDVDAYFRLKGERQLDYITSQGCRFRCTFCADPTVYGRAWFGLEPGRVGEELEDLWRRYRFTDVGFQDETFFTHAPRVGAIASEILRRDLHFTWMATMRADQGARLDGHVLAECRRAGLRRVMIGLESGSQTMLDWMKKDIRLDQVFVTAEKCRQHGVGVLFNLIVGFPGEPPESIDATMEAAKRLRAIGPDFQISLFRYRPYPGTPITDDLSKQGYALPERLLDWAAIDEDASSSPWMDRQKSRVVDRFGFYQRIGWARSSPWRAPVQALARWRCREDRYEFPIEKAVFEWLRPTS